MYRPRKLKRSPYRTAETVAAGWPSTFNTKKPYGSAARNASASWRPGFQPSLAAQRRAVPTSSCVIRSTRTVGMSHPRSAQPLCLRLDVFTSASAVVPISDPGVVHAGGSLVASFWRDVLCATTSADREWGPREGKVGSDQVGSESKDGSSSPMTRTSSVCSRGCLRWRAASTPTRCGRPRGLLPAAVAPHGWRSSTK